MHARSSGPVAVAVVALLLLPATVDAAPSVVVDIGVRTIQRLVDGLLSVPEVRAAFKDGDTLSVSVRDGAFLGEDDNYAGTLAGGKATMRDVSSIVPPASTHKITMAPAAAVSLANAYDTANTAKLLVKGGYVSLQSSRQSVQLGFNALVKTPADARLASYDPKAGDTIEHGGCTGTLAQGSTAGYFQVRLCEADYVVNSLGGVNGKIPNVKLADVCRDTRMFGLICNVPSAHLILSGGDSESIRTTCEAALGPMPRTSPDQQLWSARYAKCVNENYEEGSG